MTAGDTDEASCADDLLAESNGVKCSQQPFACENLFPCTPQMWLPTLWLDVI